MTTDAFSRRSGVRESIGEVAPPLLAGAAVIASWQLFVVIFQPSPRVLPSPLAIAEAMVSESRLLLLHTQITLFTALTGFCAALILGVALGALIISIPAIGDRMYPLLAAADTVPKMAIAPLLIIFFGFGVVPRVMMAFLIALFPIILGTVVGLRSTPPEMLFLARAVRASWLRTMVKVRIPEALPSLLAGVKLGITLSVTGAMVGEFVAPREGLGYLLVTSAWQANGPMMFAGIVALSGLGLGLYLSVAWLERRVTWWHIGHRRLVHGSL